jgi:uncharacterized membrane protein YvbJ
MGKVQYTSLFNLEVGMRNHKVVFVLAACGLVILAAGCGGGTKSPTATLKEFFAAIEKEDINAVKTFMTEDDIKQAGGDQGIKMMMGFMKEAVKTAKITGEKINGNNASVTVEMTVMGKTQTQDFDMVLVNGQWRPKPKK